MRGKVIPRFLGGIGNTVKRGAAMSSQFGKLLRLTSFGESHGKSVGGVLDGCPPGISLTEADIQPQLNRRRPGQSRLTTDRNELDVLTIVSGVEDGWTLGTPIAFFVANRDQVPGDYERFRGTPRPSHADFTYQAKYGTRSVSGGGRTSARETIARVAGGAIAERILTQQAGVEIVAWVSAVGHIESPAVDMDRITRSEVDRNPVRCPHPETARKMSRLIESLKEQRDSIGGIVNCVCRKVPAGLGEPVFDKMEAVLAQAMLSIPATKGFEFGSGFYGTRMQGSEHNDPFISTEKGLGTKTNYSGGIQGGITNGEAIYFRVAFKPPATIGIAQQTVDFEGLETVLEASGRHDPCVVPRAVPIVEGMTALVIADMLLRQRTRKKAPA
jgi:chorismate synthase